MDAGGARCTFDGLGSPRSFYVLRLKEDDNTDQNRVKFLEGLNQLEIEVIYASFYDEPCEPLYWPPKKASKGSGA